MCPIFGVLESEKDILLKKFGLHVKELRKSKMKTQIEVSSAMQRDQQSLQRVESGKVNPSLTYLIDLAEALEVDLAQLIRFLPEQSLSS